MFSAGVPGLLASWLSVFPPVPVAIVDLIVALDPSVTLRHGDVPVSAPGLREMVAVAVTPGASPDKRSAATFLNDLWNYDLLAHYGVRDAELGAMGQRWRQ